VQRGLLAIEELGSNPFVGIRLRGELDGLFRWTTGDYRIVYKIDEEKRLLSYLTWGLEGLFMIRPLPRLLGSLLD
jgi:mRNA-degrading endonuclease RelE of RelBE toxin-antitoxin system